MFMLCFNADQQITWQSTESDPEGRRPEQLLKVSTGRSVFYRPVCVLETRWLLRIHLRAQLPLDNNRLGLVQACLCSDNLLTAKNTADATSATQQSFVEAEE